MKLLKQLFPVLVVLVLWSSCTEDDNPIPGVIPPSSSVSSSAETIDANGTFSVVLTAQDGESPLNTLTIQKDGSNVAPSDISIGPSTAAANPILLFGSDKTSFSYDITIQTDLMAGESANYTFIVDAENNDNTTETVTVDVLVAMDPPVLDFNGDILTQTTFWQVPLTATMGSDSMATIAVYENGVLADANRISLGAMTVWSVNPYSLVAEDKATFSKDLLLDFPTANGDYEYWVIVADAAGLTDTVAFLAEGFVAGTPLSLDTTGIIFYNRAGTMDGGLDLDAPGAVMSGSTEAHIRDLGIDTNMPNATNWIRQVEGRNGASIVLIPADNFAAIDSKEGVAAEFATGSGAPTTLAAGMIIGVQDANNVMYIVKFDEVNLTADDNNDNYSVSIKY